MTRPPESSAVHAIGVDVGGTKCLAVLLSPSGDVVEQARQPTPRGEEELIAVVAKLVEDLSASGQHVDVVGVGMPGLIRADGVLAFAPNLPGVVDLPVKAELEDRIGRAVVVDNDATVACWGEVRAGAARGRRDVVMVTLGTGIGGGLVLDGRLHRGAHGFAGEIGHMTVDPHGPACPCGRRGCWERYASGSGLGRLARDAAVAGRIPAVVEAAGGDPDAVRGEHVTAAARHGDPTAVMVVDEYAQWLAIGLASLAVVLDPELFVLGGGLMAAGDLFLGPARRALTSWLSGSAHRPEIEMVPAELGESAGAIGAGLLALDQLVDAEARGA